MATDDGGADTAPRKPRSLFSKRPAWAQPIAAPAQRDAPVPELFSRRVLAPDELLKQKEERHQRKLDKIKERERAKAEKEKRRAEQQEKLSNSASKRLRITDETYALYGLESPSKKADAQHQSPTSLDGNARDEVNLVTKATGPDSGLAQIVNSSDDESPAQTRPRKPRRPAQPICAPSRIISVDSDSDAAIPVSTKDASPPPPDSDEEFPELAAIARERRRKRNAEAKEAQRVAGTIGGSIIPPICGTEPVIKVLVSSPIANTKALLVHCKLSQRLLEVRQSWCKRQNFTEEETQTVFLTFKLRRVYDGTTCKSLGIKVDSNGNVIGDRPEDVFRTESEDSVGERVHLVAVTEESFVELKRRRDEEKAAKAKHSFSLDQEGDETRAPQQEQDNHKIRVLIKAKGYKDYKLIVRPNTTCERIIGAFRRENKITPDRHLVLTFDGEAVEPEIQVKDTEIEDMDNLEVHVR
ncbi:hypothetical protein K461DRAFT_263769 [Myriangium duriaei CBS 260.36]|uniref:Ubiquitin-like domain-containing protein n=1 Tax=Myriangium duriaei CBS 260.36 TaxID=1168546 RepID=A0A9P4J804_9PEZI|nr:hypothetical protein K461DRAFT_263769 [Myriangium duriaei CBS 260.36]